MPSSASTFVLDSRLDADTLLIGDLELCRILLMNDARFPWVILVPRQADLRDLIDLNEIDQARLLTEINTCAHALRALTKPDKLNIATLGNVVAQLHVHVIARFVDDAAWPRPVWGVDTAEAYATGARESRLSNLRHALGIAD